MGKIWIVLACLTFLISCSKTIDNHNISMTYYQNGEQKILSLKPDDEFIEETNVNGEKIYTDKLGRWTQIRPDKVLFEDADGRQLVEDGATGKTVWKTHDLQGRVTIEDFYASINDAGTRTSIEMNKHPIQYQDFGEYAVPADTKNQSDDSPVPERYEIKVTGDSLPPIPQRIKNQYKTDDPFYINFTTLKEGWQRYKVLTANKTLTYGREIQEAFSSDRKKIELAYLKSNAKEEMLYKYDDYSVEPNSYWVDRKVGKLTTHVYEAKPCKEVPVLRSDHFKEDVKKYVEKTLKPVWYWTNYTDLTLMTGRSIIESARITMLPMSEKVWIILVASSYGNSSRIGAFWTFSVVQFDDPKPILRTWGQETFADTFTNGTQGFAKTTNWADPEKDIELYGYGDVNLDGYKDFIFRFNGWGCATEDSKAIMIITLTDKGVAEIASDHYLYNFLGFDGNKPLFEYQCFGNGQLYSTYHNESLASTRWNRHILKVVEPRKDGNMYMVSYRYNRDIEDKLSEITRKDINYLSLGGYEIIGQTKRAQEAFLQTISYSTDEQKEIVKVMLAKKMPMFVEKYEELLPELKSHDRY